MPRPAPYGFTRDSLSFNIPLPAGTGAVEAITDIVLGFRFTVEKVAAFTQVVGTGTSASRVVRVLKGTSTVVATATLLLAETTPVGVQKAFTVTAADATFSETDVLTVDFPAAGAVAFTAGQIVLVITYRQQAQRSV